MQSGKASGTMMGAAVAGGTGAVFGSFFSGKGGQFVDGLYIRFITDDMHEPLVSIELITKMANKGGRLTENASRKADEVYAFAIAGMQHQGHRQALVQSK